jgi:transposase-like protein
MGKVRKKFSSEMKLKIAQEVVSGKIGLMQASRQYQVACSTLWEWVNIVKTKNNFKITPSAKEKALEKENLKLKEKLAELYLQVELLKKMESWKQQNKSGDLSVITGSNLAQFKRGVKC